MTDFLIEFQSNAPLVLAQMRALEEQAIRSQAAINATAGRTTAGAAGASGGVLGASPASIAASSASLDRLLSRLTNLRSEMGALRAVGLEPTLAQTRREITLLSQIAQQGGGQFAHFGQEAKAGADALKGTRAQLDSTSAAFQRHVGRISETILVYASFAAAATAAVSSINLATTLDRESRRLEAVLDIPTGQGREFTQQVGQVAVSTVTPFEDLISQEDLIASAFADTEDPIKRQAQALELTNDVGRVTTVTQRDVATETENLISIMRQANVPVEKLGDVLGKVTVAGNNSSTSIGAILDALQIAIPGAKTAGVNLEQLISLIGVFRQTTQRDGNSIGNTFKTLFQTITDQKAQKNLKEITDGMVDVRDASGNLRPALDILVQLKSLIDSGAISAAKLPEVFKALAPPLNPGAAADIKLLFDSLDQLPAEFRKVQDAGDAALDALVRKINAALGPQFQQFIEQIKVGFNNLFGQDIVNSGQSLIDFLRLLGDVLNALPPDVVRTAGEFVALFAGLRLGGFVLKSTISLLGFGGIATAATEGGVALTGMARAGAVLQGVLTRLIPVAVAFAAVDIAQGVADRADIEGIQKKLVSQGLLQRGSKQELTLDVANNKDIITGLPFTDQERENARLQTQQSLTPDQLANAERFNQVLAQLDKTGDLNAESFKLLSAAVFDANGNIKTTAVSMGDMLNAAIAVTDANGDQATSLDALFKKYLDAANAASQLTAAQRQEAQATQLSAGLADDYGKSLEKLNDRQRKGKISADEYQQGLSQLSHAQDLAGQLVAALGDRLRTLIPELANAGEGNDALAAAVFNMIVTAGDNMPVIDQLISKIVGIAVATNEAAAIAAANPIVIRTIIAPPQRGTDTGQATLHGGFFEGADLSGDKAVGTRQSGTSPADIQKQIESQITALIQGLSNALRTGSSGAFGTGPSSTSKGAGAGTSKSVLDLGDFPVDKLAQAIALAQKLQAAIPGASKDAKGDVIDIIKDASFVKEIKNLDSDLLRKAIDHLAEIEKARLDLEKQRIPLLSNLVVNQGPLSSLITQPAAFGTNGAFVGGSGFNSNPDDQGITVNIGTISGQALTAAQIKQLMIEAITKALSEAAKL